MRLYSGDDLFSSKYKLKMQDSFLMSHVSRIIIEEKADMITGEKSIPGELALGRTIESKAGDSQTSIFDRRTVSKTNLRSLDDFKEDDTRPIRPTEESLRDRLENSVGLLVKQSNKRKKIVKVGSESRFDYSRTQSKLIGSVGYFEPSLNKVKLQPIIISEQDSTGLDQQSLKNNSISPSSKFEIRKFSLKHNFMGKPLVKRNTDESSLQRKEISGNLKILQQSKSQKIKPKSRFANTSSSNFNIKTKAGAKNQEESSKTPSSKQFMIQLNSAEGEERHTLHREASRESPEHCRKTHSIFDKSVVVRQSRERSKKLADKSAPKVVTSFSTALENLNFRSKRYAFQSDNKTPKDRLVSFAPTVAVQNTAARDALVEEHQKLLKRNMANRRIRILQSSIKQIENCQDHMDRAVMSDSPRKIKAPLSKL